MFLPFTKSGKEWEPVALELLQLLAVRIRDSLDPWKLAPKVGLRVEDGRTALEQLGGQDEAHLTGAGIKSWSGGVYPKPLPDGTYLCILNPNHSLRRNKITLMEEIVHSYRKHCPSQLIFSEDGIAIRNYDKKHEDEAYGIGAAVLLPWATFFHGVNNGRTVEELSEQYEVTVELVTYRIKITGAFATYRARQQRRA